MKALRSKINKKATEVLQAARGIDRSTLVKFGVLVGCAGAQAAFASTGSGLPWETPLQTINSSVSGPLAGSVATVGIVGGGCMMMFGSEMNHMLKTILNFACAGAVALGGAKIVSTLFTTSGSLIF